MNELAPALVKALTELSVVEKAHEGHHGAYAGLDDVVKRTRPVLAEHGLVALTSVHEHDSGYACTVTLLHTSGESMDFQPLPFPGGKDAQSTGSWITYFRRYALLAALGMATGEDDDGAKAVPAAPGPTFMELDAAKDLMRLLAGGDADTAKAAWTAIATKTPWTEDALRAAYEAWVNQPKDAA